jgi:hypothetical protein
MNEKCKQHCGCGKVLDRRNGSVRRRSSKVQLRKDRLGAVLGPVTFALTIGVENTGLLPEV